MNLEPGRATKRVAALLWPEVFDAIRAAATSHVRPMSEIAAELLLIGFDEQRRIDRFGRQYPALARPLPPPLRAISPGKSGHRSKAINFVGFVTSPDASSNPSALSRGGS